MVFILGQMGVDMKVGGAKASKMVSELILTRIKNRLNTGYGKMESACSGLMKRLLSL